MLRESIHDESPRVRLEAIVACSYVPKPETVEVLVQALDSPNDRFIDYALAQSIRALQPLWKPALAAGKLTFGGNATHAEHLKKIASTAPAVEHPGKIVYDALCLNCHQPGGNGLPGVYPALAGSDWIAGDAATLAKIVIHGLNGPMKVKGEDFKQVAPIPMPPMGLNDQQIADVLTYIRSNFGNQAAAVKPEEVKAARDATSNRNGFWTAEELKK
jgi:mono/diheme cytochrome c family protein